MVQVKPASPIFVQVRKTFRLCINADEITRQMTKQMGLNFIDETQLRIINIEAANEADLLRKEAIKA
ncbi:MAG: hypothetical protein EHM20_10315, partial [Alphaproteobacteria bacterium]